MIGEPAVASSAADADDDRGDWDAWLEAEDDRQDEPALAGASGAAQPGADDEDGDQLEEDGSGPPSTPAAPERGGGYDPLPPCTITVRQGDCVLSIARRYGFDPSTIWEHPNNAALRESRERNLLLPGDALYIPEREERWVQRPTGRNHRFAVKQRSDCIVTLRFCKGGEPRAGVPYTLRVDGATYEGETDGDGRVRQAVRADARGGEITLHDKGKNERYPVRIGHLNPVVDATGAQARLNHLGFWCGAVDGKIGPRTRRALRAFQRARGLEVSGEVDDATRAELQKVHGS